MAEAHPALEPWTQRLVARPPWSPWRLSLALGAGLTTLFLAVEAALGRFALLLDDEHRRGDFRVALVLIALTAYLPGAIAQLVRGARATIDALAPARPGADERWGLESLARALAFRREQRRARPAPIR